MKSLVRVYESEAGAPGFVWMHGGGFTGGDIDMPEADWVSKSLAARGVTVVSVDYRRAGRRVRYPIPSDDVLTAWRWTVERATEMRVSSLAIGGASAGANLAAGAVLRLLQEGHTPLPSSVVLIYPTLLAVQPAPDPALRAALDADPAADHFGPAAVRRMYEAYLGGPVDDAPVGAVPGRASRADLAGFPPTLVVDAEVDELRLSGAAFAAALNDAGRRGHEVVEPGTIHGYLNDPALPAASRTLDRVADWLR